MELIQLQGSPTVKLDLHIGNQIHALHQQVPDIEWGGYILYSQEGSIDDPDNLRFIVHHIHPMCYGTAGYFEWNNEPHQVLELFEEFPELMTGELKMGLIHTHHKLGIYFSHTDNEELMESTPLYKGGIYLSLIVGYSPNYTARACVNMKYTTAFDVQDAKSTVTGNAIGYYHCKVVSKRQEIFEKKLKEIYKDYKESQKPRNFPYKQTFTPANHDTDQLNMFAEDWFGQEELEETWNIYAPEDFALRAIPTNAQKRSRKSKK